MNAIRPRRGRSEQDAALADAENADVIVNTKVRTTMSLRMVIIRFAMVSDDDGQRPAMPKSSRHWINRVCIRRTNYRETSSPTFPAEH